MVDPLVEAARPLYPSKVWDDINCRLFTAFWSLSLYDLYVPTRRYDDEISRAKQAIKDLDTDQEMVSTLYIDMLKTLIGIVLIYVINKSDYSVQGLVAKVVFRQY